MLSASNRDRHDQRNASAYNEKSVIVFGDKKETGQFNISECDDLDQAVGADWILGYIVPDKGSESRFVRPLS